MILADEINRTPPKTQAALLEAMQEHQVTAGGQTLPPARAVLRAGDAEPDRAGRDLPAARGPARPLHVQHHGRLPDAGRKRSQIMKATTQHGKPRRSSRSSTAEQILQLQEMVRQVVVADHVFDYAADLVRATRPKEPGVPKFVPRAGRLGGRAAGQPVPDPRRQGAGGPARPAARHDRGHPRGRLPGAAAPAHDHVQRRRRGDHDRRRHPPADRRDPAAAGRGGGPCRRGEGAHSTIVINRT